MVLKTLDLLGPMHGYAITERIGQISDNVLAVNQGTLYPLLLRLENEGSVSSEWGTSDNNRRARFYRITPGGRRQLQIEINGWRQTAELVGKFLSAKAENFS